MTLCKSTHSSSNRVSLNLRPQSPDPNSILSFLVDELQAAEDAGQRAWIFGHVPPGVSDTMRDQVRSSLDSVASRRSLL